MAIIYLKQFVSELNVGGLIVRAKKDPEGRAYVEVPEARAALVGLVAEIEGPVGPPLEIAEPLEVLDAELAAAPEPVRRNRNPEPVKTAKPKLSTKSKRRR